MDREPRFRHSLLSVFVLAGLVLFLTTEALGAFSAIHRTSLGLVWIVAFPLLASRIHLRRPAVDPWVALCGVAIAAIFTATALAAVYSPPNSSDAMAYHLPRVIYWAEQRHVGFFPTPYLNQIMLQPLAEFAQLHLYVLSGSDHFANLVQWFAALGSVIGVSAIAGQMGASPRGQAVAALFAATIPAGVLAASGAKTEWVLTLWMVCAVHFALRGGFFLLGVAIGCALLTKATAYLFLPTLLLAARPTLRHAALAGLIALGINSPHYARNIDLSGSPLGFDSAQADGVYRWRNETLGWRQTASNALRHLSEQLAGRSDVWNQRVYDTVLAAHHALRIDPDSRDTTWFDGHFHRPKNSNHETDAPNRWHLIALAAIALSLRGRPALYAAAIATGFLAACLYLKWQPFMGRIFLPLFVTAAPLAGLFRPRWAQVALCLIALDAARLPALQNWVRPLRGPQSVFTVPRPAQYFADMTAWDNRASYEEAAAAIISSRCRTVALDSNILQLEYPLIALVRQQAPAIQFVHTATHNPSQRYPEPVAAIPCAVVCLGCAGKWFSEAAPPQPSAPPN